MALKRPLEVDESDTLRVPKLIKLNSDKFQKVCLNFVLSSSSRCIKLVQALFDALKGQPTIGRLKRARLHTLKGLCEEFGFLIALQNRSCAKSDYVSAITPWIKEHKFSVCSFLYRFVLQMT